MVLFVAADPAAPLSPALRQAARLLRDGGLVAFPTETVYGLGAHALDPQAVARVFAVKGRPPDNPLIVHIADPDALGQLVTAVPPLAAELAARFWPGPLTLVLDARPEVPGIVTAGLATVAVRVPDHPVARALLAEAGVPVAAPSANRSGRPSPTTAQHVRDELGDALDALVDGGPCRVGLESTVVDARGATAVVLREGGVTREQLGVPLAAIETTDVEAAHADPTAAAASPGTRHAHYQPGCRVELAERGRAGERAAALAADGERVGLIAATPAPDGVRPVGRFRDAAELAAHLYDWLRQAEQAVDVVVVEEVADAGVGRAVMDRLRRAAGA